MRLKRTHYCGTVDETLIDNEVVVCGWVHRWRDLGGVVFIDLRDREGILQVVFDPATMSVDEASKLRLEYVIGVRGRVRPRPQGMTNPRMATGKVEVLAQELEVMSRSKPLPFSLNEAMPASSEVDETLRLKYRYLDLRRPELQRNLKIRHRFLKSARDFYAENGFWEIETPILYKSTPEGARDYLVPSRLYPGQFYALPQSPQTLKQLCMMSGFDRYVQIARCFRDEDLRADRQPEFTQIDVEMSFIDQSDIYAIHERLMQRIMKDVLNLDISVPFQRIPYPEAMRRFGCDKPDLRNSLELVDLTASGRKSGFTIYHNIIDQGGVLKGLCFQEKEPLSRSELDGLTSKVANFGVKGVTWIRIKSPGDWQSPQAKFFDSALRTEIEAQLPFKPPALVMLICANEKTTLSALNVFRLEYGNRMGYTDISQYRFAWITDFPLYEYSEEEKRLTPAHHPFTRPHPDDLEVFFRSNDPKELLKVRAVAYDLVLNGYEIGGGSLRIYQEEVQSRMFSIIGLTPEQAREKFGFFLHALEFGCPPHGGIAFGVDRIAMILSNTEAIRDVIAFPKTTKAACLMSEAPSPVPDEQLKELGLAILKKT